MGLKDFVVIGSVLCSSVLYAGDIISEAPSKPDISSKYIFYLHGSVEEDEGSTEKYETAVEAIADYSDIVISEVRDDTDPNTYAEKLKVQVNGLIDKGVSAKNITISGFSKGSIISLAAAGAIQNPDVNYVLLAGCSDYLNGKYNIDTKIVVGRILSIYDSEDEKFGSCSGMISSSDKVKFKEIEIDSGKGHKLFRIPKEKFIEQWRDPLVNWTDV
jgi:hypothetical protein